MIALESDRRRGRVEQGDVYEPEFIEVGEDERRFHVLRIGGVII